MNEFPLFLPNMVKTFANYDNAHQDTQQRLKEAREALFAIIKKGYFTKIVIVDGSATMVLTEEEIEYFKEKGVVIEQLLFTQNRDLVEQFGKGHGEMQITDYMVENSRLVNEAGGFVKLTPRYFFDNIDAIFPKLKDEKNVFFYYYPFPLRLIKKYVMSIFYKISLDFYKKYFKNTENKHSKNAFGVLESVFYKQLENVPKKAIKVDFPYFSGVSGTTGKAIKNQYMLMRKNCSKLGLMAYSFKEK